MNVRAIPRTAVTSYLRLVRVPIDTAIRLLPGNGSGPSTRAKLAVDRADATVRTVVATVLGDPVLTEDAQRRQAAADERARAMHLREKAEATGEKADTRLETRRDQAEERRREAARRAEARRKEAARQRERTVRRAAKAEEQRVQASRAAAEKTEEAIDEQAPKARLESLKTEEEALREREEALTAEDEARRLGDAAARVKEERKSE